MKVTVEPAITDSGPLYVTLHGAGDHVVVGYPHDAIIHVRESSRGAKKRPDGSWYSPTKEYIFYIEGFNASV